MIHTNRRQFIKTAGTGIAALGIMPAFGGISQFLGSYETSAFPRATPESQGIPSDAIHRLATAVSNEPHVSWHSFMLIRHGNLVAEGWWAPYRPEYIHTLYSLSKSFTSTAIGLLVSEGKLDINSKVMSFFPDQLPANPDENFKQMTVKSLLTMNTGHGEDTIPKMRASADSWIKTYLSLPVEYAPGSHFLYNTGNTYMLGAILHQVTGETLQSYLAPRLFKPLDITGYDWEISPEGLNTAGYGLRIRTEDIGKLGQLYLQKGIWKGKAILPAAWVNEATRFQTTSQVNNGDWSEGYGYQFWRCTHHAYRADGAHGQFCIVMPEHDAVLAITGQTADMQKALNLVWEHLPGAMQATALPENPSAHNALKQKLALLALPVPKGSIESPLAVKHNNSKWALSANEFNIPKLQFNFTAKGCKLTTGQSAIDFGWEKWITNDKRVPYVFKSGDIFPMPSKIAGTATWVGENTLQLNLRFVEAIYGDKITCVFTGNKVSVTFFNSLAEASTPAGNDARKALEGTLI